MVQAFEFYNKGLSLVQDESCSDIKNSLLLELSGAYFAMASTIQDNAPLHLMAEENVSYSLFHEIMEESLVLYHIIKHFFKPSQNITF